MFNDEMRFAAYCESSNISNTAVSMLKIRQNTYSRSQSCRNLLRHALHIRLLSYDSAYLNYLKSVQTYEKMLKMLSHLIRSQKLLSHILGQM